MKARISVDNNVQSLTKLASPSCASYSILCLTCDEVPFQNLKTKYLSVSDSITSLEIVTVHHSRPSTTYYSIQSSPQGDDCP